MRKRQEKAAKSCVTSFLFCAICLPAYTLALAREPALLTRSGTRLAAVKMLENCVFIGTFATSSTKAQLKKPGQVFFKKLAATFQPYVPPFFFVSAYKALEEAENKEASPKEWLGEAGEKFREEIQLTIIQQISFTKIIFAKLPGYFSGFWKRPGIILQKR